MEKYRRAFSVLGIFLSFLAIALMSRPLVLANIPPPSCLWWCIPWEVFFLPDESEQYCMVIDDSGDQDLALAAPKMTRTYTAEFADGSTEKRITRRSSRTGGSLIPGIAKAMDIGTSYSNTQGDAYPYYPVDKARTDVGYDKNSIVGPNGKPIMFFLYANGQRSERINPGGDVGLFYQYDAAGNVTRKSTTADLYGFQETLLEAGPERFERTYIIRILNQATDPLLITHKRGGIDGTIVMKKYFRYVSSMPKFLS